MDVAKIGRTTERLIRGDFEVSERLWGGTQF